MQQERSVRCPSRRSPVLCLLRGVLYRECLPCETRGGEQLLCLLRVLLALIGQGQCDTESGYGYFAFPSLRRRSGISSR